MTARESIENLWDRSGADIRALLDQVEADAVYGALKALADDWADGNELRMRAEGVREDAVASREQKQAHAQGEHCFCGSECGWLRENEQGGVE